MSNLLRIVIALLSVHAFAQSEYPAKVVGITDGDTVTVLRQTSEQVKVRLHGIDAPEQSQDFGTRAKQALSSMVFGREVSVLVRDTDRYGRTVAEIVRTDGLNANLEMVKTGYAWWYQKYAPNNDDLKNAERHAQLTGQGLWVDSNPIPPWEFRNGSYTSSQSDPNNNIVTTAPTRAGPEVSIDQVAANEDTVYITKTGKKYHRGSCRYLSKSKIPISRSDAIARGYDPCSVCKP